MLMGQLAKRMSWLGRCLVCDGAARVWAWRGQIALECKRKRCGAVVSTWGSVRLDRHATKEYVD